MIINEIVSQWSSALFQLAQEENQIKKYCEEIDILVNVVVSNPKFLDIIKSSNLSFLEKSKILKESFSSFSIYIINFLLFLAQENNFGFLLPILKEFHSQCDDYIGIENGVVYSVVRLSVVQMKKLEEKLSLSTKSTVNLVNEIDDSLIAGIKIKLKSQIFDGSVKGQIDQLKSILLNS